MASGVQQRRNDHIHRVGSRLAKCAIMSSISRYRPIPNIRALERSKRNRIYALDIIITQPSKKDFWCEFLCEIEADISNQSIQKGDTNQDVQRIVWKQERKLVPEGTCWDEFSASSRKRKHSIDTVAITALRAITRCPRRGRARSPAPDRPRAAC